MASDALLEDVGPGFLDQDGVVSGPLFPVDVHEHPAAGEVVERIVQAVPDRGSHRRRDRRRAREAHAGGGRACACRC